MIISNRIKMLSEKADKIEEDLPPVFQCRVCAEYNTPCPEEPLHRGFVFATENPDGMAYARQHGVGKVQEIYLKACDDFKKSNPDHTLLHISSLEGKIYTAGYNLAYLRHMKKQSSNQNKK